MSAIALSVYLIFLIIFGIGSFFGLYQLWQFGYVGDATKRVIVLYVILSLLVIFGSIIALVVIVS